MTNTTNTTSWDIRSADILLLREAGETEAAFLSLASPDVADMVKHGHVRREDMPDRWFAVENLSHCLDSRGVDGIRGFALAAMKMLQAMAGGAPLAWQCSRAHAQAYAVIFGDRLTVIAGSLIDRPFYDMDYGDDGQIVLLSAS